VIEISPVTDTTNIDKALHNLENYDWAVFTSVNGVEAVWARLTALNLKPKFNLIRVAAIGPKTAATLESYGVKVDFVPDEYVAESILPGLGQLHGKRFLLARADIARPTLREQIEAAGGRVDEIPVYRTVPAQPELESINAIREGVDVVLFTSSSTVRNFIELIHAFNLKVHQLPGDPIFACIGPITAKTAMEYDLSTDVIAKRYTTDGLIDALQSYEFLKNVTNHEPS
jgi:uroporphyrinogen-III synthase